MSFGLVGLIAGLSEQAPGMVSLVGAGPGDLELLTLRAWRRLQTGEVLVYDNLVGPGIVDLALPTAERINVGNLHDSGHTTETLPPAALADSRQPPPADAAATPAAGWLSAHSAAGGESPVHSGAFLFDVVT